LVILPFYIQALIKKIAMRPFPDHGLDPSARPGSGRMRVKNGFRETVFHYIPIKLQNQGQAL